MRVVKIDYTRNVSTVLESEAFILEEFPDQRGDMESCFVGFEKESHTFFVLYHTFNSGKLHFKKFLIEEFDFDISQDISIEIFDPSKIDFDTAFFFKGRRSACS